MTGIGSGQGPGLSIHDLGIPPAREVSPAKINLLSQPAVAERVGSMLAEQIADRNIDVVLSWDESEDVVLAHIVGREIGSRTVQAYKSGGILFLTDGIASGEKVLLVSDTFRSPHDLLGPIGLVHSVGAEIVLVAAIVSSPHLVDIQSDDIDTTALALPDPEGAAETTDTDSPK